jgi:hypothetical protein
MLFIVSNMSSNLTWNCGNASSVHGLSTRCSVLACFGDLPMYILTLACVSHFDVFLLCAVRTYAGHPNGWKCFDFGYVFKVLNA